MEKGDAGQGGGKEDEVDRDRPERRCLDRGGGGLPRAEEEGKAGRADGG